MSGSYLQERPRRVHLSIQPNIFRTEFLAPHGEVRGELGASDFAIRNEAEVASAARSWTSTSHTFVDQHRTQSPRHFHKVSLRTKYCADVLVSGRSFVPQFR